VFGNDVSIGLDWTEMRNWDNFRTLLYTIPQKTQKLFNFNFNMSDEIIVPEISIPEKLVFRFI
jgi:hypothetical protein